MHLRPDRLRVHAADAAALADALVELGPPPTAVAERVETAALRARRELVEIAAALRGAATAAEAGDREAQDAFRRVGGAW